MNVSFSGDPCRIMKIAGSRTYIADDKDGDGVFETIIRQQTKGCADVSDAVRGKFQLSAKDEILPDAIDAIFDDATTRQAMESDGVIYLHEETPDCV